MAITLKFSGGVTRQFEEADSIEVNSLERRSSSGNIVIGSGLGALEKIVLASASSAGVQILSDLDVDGNLNVDGTSTIVTSETVQGSFTVEGDVNLGNNDGDTVTIGGGTSDIINLEADLVLGAGTVSVGSSVTDYLNDLWVRAANDNGPDNDAYDLKTSGTNAGAYSIGVDPSLLSSSTATDLMTVLDDLDAAIAGSGSTLQQAYAAGNTIAVTTAEGALQFSNTADVTNLLELSRTFAGAGIGLSITMGASTTGDALFVNNSGSGDALDVQDGGGSVLQVTGAGAVNVTPTSGQDLVLTTTGAGGLMDLNAGENLDIDVTGTFDMLSTGTFSIDGTGASNVTATSGNLTLSTATSGTLILDSVALVDINAGANLDIDVTGTFDMLATSTFSIDGTGSSNVTATSGNLTLSTVTSGDVILSADGTIKVGASVSDYASEIWLIAVNDNGPNADAYNLVASGTNAGAYSIGVDPSLLSSSTATDLMTVLDDLDAAIAGSGSTLQQAYVAGNTIAVTTAEGALQFSNTADVTNLLELSRTFAGAGIGLSITMGASTTGDALFINNSGSGDALDVQDGGGSVLQVTGAGAVNVTPTSGQDLILTTVGAGGLMDLNAGENLDIDVTGTFDMLSTGTFSIDGTGASNVTATGGNLTLSTVTSGDVILSAGGTIKVGASVSDYASEIWLVAVNDNGPDLVAYNLVASGTNAGAYSIGVDPSLLSSSTATDLMTVLDDLDAAIAGSGSTLQQAYAAGNTIAVTTAEGAPQFSNTTDVTNLLELSRTFAGAGIGLSITMGASTTGDALFINNSGSGDALDVQDGGGSVLQVTGAGAVNVTPTSGQSLTMTAAGAGVVDVNAAGAITLDSTGAGISLDAAGASNFSTSSGALTLSGAGLNLDSVLASGVGLITLQNTGTSPNGVAFKIPESNADPAAAGNFGHLYVKDVSSVSELFWRDDTNAALQITSNGALNGGGLPLHEKSVGDIVQGAWPGLYTVARFAYDPTLYSNASNFYFTTVLNVSNVSLTGRARLYDVAGAVYVTGTSLTTSSLGPVYLASGALTVGASSGNLKNSMTVYEIHIDVSAGGSSGADLVTHGNSVIRAVL